MLIFQYSFNYSLVRKQQYNFLTNYIDYPKKTKGRANNSCLLPSLSINYAGLILYGNGSATSAHTIIYF